MRTDQVLDAGLTTDPDDDLAPLAAALDDLPPRVRTVAVLRLADDVPLDDVVRVLALPEVEVTAAEQEALRVLVPAAGGADLLPWRFDALAAVVPDDTAADRATDAVLAVRRRRRTTAALAAAALVAAVPVTVAVLDRPADPAAVDGVDRAEPRAATAVGRRPGRTAARVAGRRRRVPRGGPPRAVGHSTTTRRSPTAPWSTRATRGAGRVALVVADTPSGLDGAWLIGPPYAPVDELRPWVPAQIGRNRPAAVLVEGFGRAAVVVVAAPGDAVEISPRLLSEQSGALRREWTAVRADDGTAVVEVDGPEVGRSAAVRVLRDGRLAARPAVGVPGAGGRTGPFELEPLRRGTADPDPALVGEAAARIALPFGVGVDALSTELLWSGELTRTGGLGSVVVLAARVPGNAHVVTAFGRLGSVRGGLEVPCGTTSFPAELPPSIVTVATVCSVFDGSDAGADRTWLVVTAPRESRGGRGARRRRPGARPDVGRGGWGDDAHAGRRRSRCGWRTPTVGRWTSSRSRRPPRRRSATTATTDPRRAAGPRAGEPAPPPRCRPRPTRGRRPTPAGPAACSRRTGSARASGRRRPGRRASRPWWPAPAGCAGRSTRSARAGW